MNRAITYDEFCRRCEKQGLSQHMFSRLHPAEEIQRYCQVKDAETHWPDIQQTLEGKVDRVREIELALESESDTERIQILLSELWQLYKWTFNGFKIKGLAEQRI
mgnify:CR=1 FL=1